MPANAFVNYRLRLQVRSDSQEGDLVTYLRTKDLALSEREKVLGAIAAFWLPFALQQQGQVSQGDLQQSARTAIYRLQQHIGYVAATFGLREELDLAWSSDPGRLQAPGPPYPQPAPVQREAIPALAHADALPGVTGMEDLLYQPEDEHLATLFRLDEPNDPR